MEFKGKFLKRGIGVTRTGTCQCQIEMETAGERAVVGITARKAGKGAFACLSPGWWNLNGGGVPVRHDKISDPSVIAVRSSHAVVDIAGAVE